MLSPFILRTVTIMLVLQVRKLNAMLGPKDSTSTARFEPEWLDGCVHGARKGHNVS